MSSRTSNSRPNPDKVLIDIADYVTGFRISSQEAYATARLCLMDTLGCGLEALEYPACTKLLGPIVPGTMGPSSLVQAGYSSASSPQPRVSIRHSRAVA